MGVLSDMAFGLGLMENPEVRCPKNLRGWWRFRWEGYHDLEIVRVKPWAFGQWEIWAKCKKCGASLHRLGLTDTDLTRAGIKFPKR